MLSRCGIAQSSPLEITASFWRVPSCRVIKPSRWGEIKEALYADVIQISDVKPMSVNDVKARIDIVKKLKTIMDDGVHYGSIAASKPCLFKVSAEVLLPKTLFLHVIPF